MLTGLKMTFPALNPGLAKIVENFQCVFIIFISLWSAHLINNKVITKLTFIAYII